MTRNKAYKFLLLPNAEHDVLYLDCRKCGKEEWIFT